MISYLPHNQEDDVEADKLGFAAFFSLALRRFMSVPPKVMGRGEAAAAAGGGIPLGRRRRREAALGAAALGSEDEDTENDYGRGGGRKFLRRDLSSDRHPNGIGTGLVAGQKWGRGSAGLSKQGVAAGGGMLRHRASLGLASKLQRSNQATAEAEMLARRRLAVAAARNKRLGKRQRGYEEGSDSGDGDDVFDDTAPGPYRGGDSGATNGGMRLEQLLKSADLISLLDGDGGEPDVRGYGQKQSNMGAGRGRHLPGRGSGDTAVKKRTRKAMVDGGATLSRKSLLGAGGVRGGVGTRKGPSKRQGGRASESLVQRHAEYDEEEEEVYEARTAWRRHGQLRPPGPLPPLPKSAFKGEPSH